VGEWSVSRGDDHRSDADLLAAVVDRDRGALRLLYERHEPWITARVARRCAVPEIVEEVVQDTFVAVWRSAARYGGQGEVPAWLWGIAIHRLLHAVRPRRNLMEKLRAVRPGDQTSAEEQVLLGVQHGPLGAALDSLSPELRAVVQATVLDGLSSAEAGRLLGIPTGTVKTRLKRAKAEMREAIA